MPSRIPASLAIVAVLGAVSSAQAQPHRRPHGLPPVSGTLRMPPEEFGAGRSRPQVRAMRRAAPEGIVQVIRGGAYPRATTYRAFAPAERWATGGTGVRGIVGNTGNPYFGQTGWGTADSATTGSGFAPRQGWRQRGFLTAGAEAPLTDRYGEAPLYADARFDQEAYGAGPQLPFYGSGTPYGMGYYSSGSSAGPGGSPGGLATYRSGSYGYAPRVLGAAGYGGWAPQGCTCGARIVYLPRHRRHASELR